MGNPDPVREDIVMLISHNYGADVAKFFSHAAEADSTPVFLHHSYQVLRELMGEAKAREQIDLILKQHNAVQPYE